jgi:flagellar basal-body rod modification protein FlgD
MAISSLSGQTPSPSAVTATLPSATAAKGATPALAESAGTTSPITAAEGRDTFLRLLVAQLEHQDPLKPMENSDFTGQLAQFSMLEQIESMNKNLRSMVDAQQALNGLQTKMQATSLVGKEVMIKGNSFQVENQRPSQPLTYTLASASTEVIIEFQNKAGGAPVRFKQTNVPAGEYELPRDNKDVKQWLKGLTDGTKEYTAQIYAKDGAGQPVAADMFIQGRVTGVEYSADQPFFLMGKHRLAFSDLVRIQQ